MAAHLANMRDPAELARAKELTSEILRMTNNLSFTGHVDLREREVEAYAMLMEKREPLVGELMQLKEKIDKAMEASPEFAVIKQTINDITALDKKHLSFFKRLSEGVRKSHKEVKQAQKLNAAYAHQEPESHIFDKKH